jgi:cytochrome b6-f complex subunit 4
MSQDSTPNEQDTIPFYPDHIKTELWVMVGVLVIVFIIGGLALLKPVGIGDPADPLNTPAHVKPEWYFLALYQLLRFIPKTTGVVLPMIAVGLILIWPFIDRKPDRSPKIYRIRMIFVAVVVIVLIAMTIWGEVS